MVCAASLLLHNYFVAAASLLFHCCFTTASLLLHCCFTAASLLFRRCFTSASLLLQCCFTAASLLLRCCSTAALLLLQCCFTAASLLLLLLHLDPIYQFCPLREITLSLTGTQTGWCCVLRCVLCCKQSWAKSFNFMILKIKSDHWLKNNLKIKSFLKW